MRCMSRRNRARPCRSSAPSGWAGIVRAGEARTQPNVPGLSAERLAELTQSARGYGFHATIKPPFYLREGRSEAELLDAFAAFAKGREPFEVQLGLRSLGGFLALMMTPPDHRMSALAADAVRDLDPFRALPSEAELARRRKSGLSAQQETLLQQWGYPYVMGEFRFHMTLSTPTAGRPGTRRHRRRPDAAGRSGDGGALPGGRPGAVQTGKQGAPISSRSSGSGSGG